MTKLQTRDEKGAPSGYVGLDASGNASLPTKYVNAAQVFASIGAAGQTAIGPLNTIVGGGPVAPGIAFGSPPDATLYRSAAYTLRVGEILEVNQSLSIGIANNAFLNLKNDANGIYFGAASDTNLYRSSANSLQTDGQFLAKGQIVANYGVGQQVQIDSSGIIKWGSPPDTNLYRYGPGSLKTDGEVRINADLIIAMNNTAKAWFGSALDTNLYRSAAGTLRTDGNFYAGQAIYAATPILAYNGQPGQVYLTNGPANGGAIFFGSAADTILYRYGGAILATDGQFYAGRDIFVNLKDEPNRKLYFGGAGDTNLYRAAAGQLKTDGAFYAVGVSGFSWTGSTWALQTNTAGDVQIAHNLVVSGTITGAGVGGEIGYVERTTDQAISSGTITWIGPQSFSCPGGNVIVEVFCSCVALSGTIGLIVVVDGANQGEIAQVGGVSGAQVMVGGRRRLNLAAGSHSFAVNVIALSGTATLFASTGGANPAPAFMRVSAA